MSRVLKRSSTNHLTLALIVLASGAIASAQQPKPTAPPQPGANPIQMIEDALIRIDAGDFQEAYALYERAKRLDPSQVKIKLLEGLILLQGRKAAEALPLLQDFNKSQEARLEWRGFAAIGKCCRELKWHRQAIRPLEQARELAPPNDAGGKPVRALITIELATCEFALRQMKKAKEHTKEAETNSPNNAEVQQRVAELHAQMSDFPAAMKALNRAIGIQLSKVASNPLSQKEYNSLVESYDLKLQLCTKLRDEKPKDPVNYVDAAEAMRNKADTQKRINLLIARDVALKTLATDPKIASLHIFCAGIEIELGGLDDALDRLNQVLRIDPTNKDATAMRQALQDRMRGRAKP
jgi:tetratricopeptide (TPR) repeat protein